VEEDKKWEERRKRADIVRSFLFGKVSNRVCLLITRMYLWGFLEVPLADLTDEQLLREKWIGQKTINELRTVILAPEQPGGEASSVTAVN